MPHSNIVHKPSDICSGRLSRSVYSTIVRLCLHFIEPVRRRHPFQAQERGRHIVHLMWHAREVPMSGSNAVNERSSAMNKLLKITVASLSMLLGITAFAQSAAPNDAQIAAIVVTANTVDIDAGKLAQKKASGKEVKAFGKQMATDHMGVNKQATALVKKLKITPEQSDTSKSLKQDGDANIAKLKNLKGKDFDKAYIDNEVTYHEAVIDALDKTLIPNAKNEELKSLLVKVRPAFVAHLDHAKQIQPSQKKEAQKANQATAHRRTQPTHQKDNHKNERKTRCARVSCAAKGKGSHHR